MQVANDCMANIFTLIGDDCDRSVFINDPSQTSYEFTALEEGIWYFAVIAVSANGLEGPPTTAAMKSI